MPDSSPPLITQPERKPKPPPNWLRPRSEGPNLLANTSGWRPASASKGSRPLDISEPLSCASKAGADAVPSLYGSRMADAE